MEGANTAESSNNNLMIAALGVGVGLIFLSQNKKRDLSNEEFDDGSNPYANMTESQYVASEPDATREPKKWEKWVQAAGAVFKFVSDLFGPGGPFHKPKNNSAQNAFILGSVSNQFSGYSFNANSNPWSTGQFGALSFGNYGGLGTIPGGSYGNSNFPTGGGFGIPGGSGFPGGGGFGG